MVAFSGSEADAVAMVVPVEMFSANELDATEVDKVGVSLTLLMTIVISELVAPLPSDAVKVSV